MSYPPGPWSTSEDLGSKFQVPCTWDFRSRTYPNADWTTDWKGRQLAQEFNLGTRSRSGYRLPDYRNRIEHGLILPTLGASYARKGITRYIGSNVFAYSKTPGTSFVNRELRARRVFPLYSPSTDPGNLLADSGEYMEAYLRLKEKYTGAVAHMGSTLGEAANTASEMAGLVRALHEEVLVNIERLAARILANLHHYRHHPLDLLEDAADYWLTWSFGIKPLLQDVHDLGEALASIYHTEGLLERCEAMKVTKKPVITSSTQAVSFSGAGAIYYKVDKTVEQIYKVKLGGVVGPSNWDRDPFSTVGLSLDEVLPTVWDLLPWSWMVDYIIRVEDFIRAFTGADLTFVDSWTIIVKESRTQYRFTPTSQGWDGVTGTQAFITSLRFDWSRSPGIEPPPFHIKFNNVLNTAQMLNILAATTAVFGKGIQNRVMGLLSRGS